MSGLILKSAQVLQIVVISAVCLLGVESKVHARLITFYFEAVWPHEPNGSYPFAMGTTARGSYTFEVSTPPTISGSENSFTRYSDAVQDFSVTIDGYGSGTGSSGYILIGDPVQTTGSSSFLSDKYEVHTTAVTGITFISSSHGPRNLLNASLLLQDIDLQGLDSESLSTSPPELSYFLDNTEPNSDSDYARLYMNFDTPSGGFDSAPFDLTALAREPLGVPEPSAIAFMTMAVTGVLGYYGYRRRARLKRASLE